MSSSSLAPLSTPLTQLFGVAHPIMLAGMTVSGPELCASVCNAGGMGVMGGATYTPKVLRKEIDELKSLLDNPKAPFGIDLLLPQVGGNARKTNHDYTHGHLPELIDIIIESGARLFVSAVGIPPEWVVSKLHAHNILVQNMIGAPKHAIKALSVGVDIICAQGSEGGGHTGEIATMVLIPQVVDMVRGKLSPLTQQQVLVVAAGGIYDGRGIAAALNLGASGVWVGTRFVASLECLAPPRHVKAVIEAESDQTIRTTIYSGRPMRVLKNEHNTEWELHRKPEMLQLLDQGLIPIEHDSRKKQEERGLAANFPLIMGQAVGGIHDVLPAAEIVRRMVDETVVALERTSTFCRL